MKAQGVNSRGWRIRTSEGLTKNAQLQHIRSTKHVNQKLGKKALNIKFDWVEFMSKEYFGVIDAECYKKMLEIGKCKEVFWRVDGSQCELLRAKSKKEFLNAKKHTVVLQLLHELWCTKIDYIHQCWVSSGSQEINKFRTRKAYGEGKYCQGTVTWAQICNKQLEYSEVQYMPGVPHWEGCYNQTGQLYMQEMQR